MIKKTKILVVDDNEDLCVNIKDILEIKDYSVSIATDGYKAIETVKHNGIDLVLMDIKMPVMDGVETYKNIQKIAPGTPVIMMTAFAVEELIRESLKNGVFGVIKKPIDFNKLFSMIDNAFLNGSMILVIDDDQNLCENLKDVLSEKGYKVATAFNSKSAIQKAHENDYEIMLLDMKLPPLNGLETYLEIREIRPNVVIIIITGYISEMDNFVEEALENNAYSCIEKPIDMDQLFSMLKTIETQKKNGNYKKPV